MAARQKEPVNDTCETVEINKGTPVGVWGDKHPLEGTIGQDSATIFAPILKELFNLSLSWSPGR